VKFQEIGMTILLLSECSVVCIHSCVWRHTAIYITVHVLLIDMYVFIQSSLHTLYL